MKNWMCPYHNIGYNLKNEVCMPFDDEGAHLYIECAYQNSIEEL